MRFCVTPKKDLIDSWAAAAGPSGRLSTLPLRKRTVSPYSVSAAVAGGGLARPHLSRLLTCDDTHVQTTAALARCTTTPP